MYDIERIAKKKRRLPCHSGMYHMYTHTVCDMYDVYNYNVCYMYDMYNYNVCYKFNLISHLFLSLSNKLVF